ncbi:hypothetical protein A7D23_11325 [Dehalobacter sp. TeCB1]|nr:hypothetical protein A7D23_11325 [Dehalobacter sp. TeCB1]
MLYNQARSGTFTILSTQNTYVLEFEKTMYNLTLEFDGDVSTTSFKIRINDGDPIRIYEIWPTKFENVEVYKIEFIKQYAVSSDIEVYYQGFIK